MNNAEKFKQIFGLYATELWSMPESDFLEWLNRDVETTQIDHDADFSKKASISCGHENDLISRQAAIEALADMHCKSDEDGYVWIIRSDAWARIDALPSVTPKRKCGKWIDAVIPNDNGGLPVQVCDQCNTFFPLAYTGGGHRFCPSCGAKMEVEHE